MPNDDFDVSLLHSAPDVVAWIVPGVSLFSWTSRSLTVPGGWTALATRSGQDSRLVSAGSRYEDEDTQDILFVRSGAIECGFDIPNPSSADGFACHGRATLFVRIVDESSELTIFRKTLMGSANVFRQADLQRYLHESVHKAATRYAREHPAEELLQPLPATDVRALLDRDVGGICFSSGLAMADPVSLIFTSPAWLDHCHRENAEQRHHRYVAARAQVQEALTRAQAERVSHLVGMMQQLQQAADQHGDLPMAELLKTFGESERAEMYKALWHLSPDTAKTRFIATVSGQDLLLFEPAELSRPVRRTTLPAELGPLRSVTLDVAAREAGVLMIGARLGVHLVLIDTGEVQHVLRAGDGDLPEVKGGVNAAAMNSDRVFATHSEIGLLAWSRDKLETPAEQLYMEITHGADTVRGARVTEELLWFAVDETLWAAPLIDNPPAPADRYAGSGARISAFTVSRDRVYAGNVEGQILAWDMGAADSCRSLRAATGNPIESIDVIDAGGIDHLIVADRSNALQAFVVGDNYIRRYESGATPVRRAVVADDLFVAMNDNRDRLIAWDPEKPAAPLGHAIVPHFTGSTIQDICLVPHA